MGKLTDKLFHHEKSSETGLTVVPIPPFEDLASHPKGDSSTVSSITTTSTTSTPSESSPSHPSLLQTIKDKVFHHNTAPQVQTIPVIAEEVLIAVPVATTTLITPAPIIEKNEAPKVATEHPLDVLAEKLIHPHIAGTSFIHPFERPLEVHTIAETHHLPVPIEHAHTPAHTPVHIPIPAPLPPFEDIVLVEEVAIVPEPTIPGEVSVPSIDEHHTYTPMKGLEGAYEVTNSSPLKASSATGVKRKLHQD